ncbi:MAG: LysR family transcriptional regulator [Clostridiales bacterium]|nr:LysR family transcriptional regulator [Clostridiales bacterium]
MYNKKLDTFLLVSECKSFSKAAQALYITPSAVIQQINHLEQELQVTLFTRTKHGLALTDAGRYLKNEGEIYVKEGKRIRQELLSVSTKVNTICVGTSLNYKIRLLYDLWILFSNKKEDYNIRLVNLATGPNHFTQADLIEGIRADVPWQKDWAFLKICEMPLGCAVSKDHPLASKKVLRYDDLQKYPVFVMKHMPKENENALFHNFKMHQIHPTITDMVEESLIWECCCHQCILLAPACWQDILFDMVILPFEWNCTLSYGFFYHENASVPVKEFLKYIHEVYHEKNGPEIVPFF